MKRTIPFFTLIIVISLFFACTEEAPVTPVSPVIDHIAPFVEWIDPESGSELSGTVELVFSVYDENSIDRVVIYRNGRSPEDWQPAATDDTLYTLEWNTIDVEDGVYIWEARAWDDSGNLGISPSLVVRVRNNEEPSPEDSTPPVVIWHSPEASSVVSGDVVLRFDAMDNVGIDSLKLYVNGACPEGCALQGHQNIEYSIIWVTEDIEDGIYNLTVIAWDSSGNRGSCPSLMLRVKNQADPPPEDRLPPDVWWISPDGGSTLSGTVSLQVRFFDESSVDSVRLLKNGATVATIFPPYDSRGGQRGGREFEAEYIWNTLPDSDGVYIWEARAWDEAGNMGTSPSLLVRVRNGEEPPPEDRTPPVVTWLSPEPGSTVEGAVELRFQALDDVGLDSVKVYLNGQELQNLINMEEFLDANIIWITSDYPDGNYLIDIRAWDSAGNMGAGVGVVLTVRNVVPRVIYVPDDYETIQDAINASEDGDTVRVRPGTYREGLRLMGKNIWLESEEGPEVTVIDGDNQNDCISVRDEDLVIRGFKFVGDWKGITAVPSSRYFVYNCIFVGFPGHGAMIDDSNSEVYNCVFDSCVNGVSCGYTWGKLRNSIFVHCDLALSENATFESHLDYGWSLFWDNNRDYNGKGFDYKDSDIRSNPQFIPDTYRLSPESSAIDAGDPSILDTDGSCSDIGIYGGPYAYSIP